MAEDTQEPEKLDPQCSDQLIYLLQDATDNIRLAKRQQWNVGYYTILLYAALVLVADRVAGAVPALLSVKLVLAVIGTVLAGVALVGGVAVIWNMQGWMGKYRNRILKAEAKFCDEYKKIVETRPPTYTAKSHASAIPSLLTVVLSLGWVVTVGLVIEAFVAAC